MPPGIAQNRLHTTGQGNKGAVTAFKAASHPAVKSGAAGQLTQFKPAVHSSASNNGTPVVQQYIDEITNLENNIPPVGQQLFLKTDGGGEHWVDEGGDAWTGVQPPFPSFSPGSVKELTPEEKRKQFQERKKARQEKLRLESEARRRKKFETIEKAELPEGAEPITIDPYSLEEGMTQRQANALKNTVLGVKMTVPATNIRDADLGFVGEDIIFTLLDHTKWFLADGLIWAQMEGGVISGVAKFNTGNAAKMEQILCTRMLILNEEPQPRSGAGRAAPEEQRGSKRQPAKDEAWYLGRMWDMHDDNRTGRETSTFDAKYDGNKKIATIIHTGPWGKGVRDPGQSQVMGSQNAKNHIVDAWHPGAEGHEKAGLKEKIGGRWEWLHLVGSSLGGPNTVNNLVAGSYDANTKMIALEHRVANWGAINYDKEFKPTPFKPIKIVTEADINPVKSHAASNIKMRVWHGDKAVVDGEYAASDQTVISKLQYAAEEERVDKAIEAAR